MRRKVLAKLSPRWKERVIPCSLKVTAFIWGFYSVLGSWLKNTKHSYYPLGWHESDTVPTWNISLKILHLSTVCIKSKIHSCAEGNTKLMNLSIPEKWLRWCIVLGWCREVDCTLGGPQWCWSCQEELPAWEQPCLAFLSTRAREAELQLLLGWGLGQSMSSSALAASPAVLGWKLCVFYSHLSEVGQLCAVH